MTVYLGSEALGHIHRGRDHFYFVVNGQNFISLEGYPTQTLAEQALITWCLRQRQNRLQAMQQKHDVLHGQEQELLIEIQELKRMLE